MFASSITEPFLLLIVFSLRRSHFVALGRFSMDPSLDPLYVEVLVSQLLVRMIAVLQITFVL